MTLLVQNKKMKASSKNGVKVYNFGIPAFKSITGLVTCPNARACVSGCYARSGAYLFSNVAKVFEKRLEITQQDNFSDIMHHELNMLSLKNDKIIVRVHDSGDFYSLEYLYKWLKVIENNPKIFFYAYTKRVKLLKSVKLPKNFKVIFSYGGSEDYFISPSTDRHAKVFETREDLEKSGYAYANEDDLQAIGKNKKIGLVYHGTKSIEKTQWLKVGY